MAFLAPSPGKILQSQKSFCAKIFAMPPRRPRPRAVAASTNSFSVLGDADAVAEAVERGASQSPKAAPSPKLPCPRVYRKWLSFPEESGPISHVKSSEVTIMTYNVLAQTYVSSKIFPTSPRRVLRAPFRRRAVPSDILKHVVENNVDIVCLQELEVGEVSRIADALPGFDGQAYKQRTSAGSRSTKKDGCGIFWRRERFEQLEDIEPSHVELNIIAEDPVLVGVVEEKQLAVRDCVAALIGLSERETGIRFVVGNVHIFWNPEYENLKLAQAHCFVRAATALAGKVGTKNVILTGDWNSLPDSAVYELLTRGALDAGNAELGNLPADVLSLVNDREVHTLRFSSAIPHLVDGPPTATDDDALLSTFTWKFRGALDHIFLSTGCGNMVTGCLSLPCAKDFAKSFITALPSEAHPSDHLPVIMRASIASDTNA